jgi:hypothetical protein
MVFAPQIIRAKASGLATALAKLSQKEREASPSQSLVADYNSLRLSAMAMSPSWQEIWPPEVERTKSDSGSVHVNATVGDIMAFAEQIVELSKAQGG